MRKALGIVIGENQHGFKAGHSSTTVILSIQGRMPLTFPWFIGNMVEIPKDQPDFGCKLVFGSHSLD